MALLSPKLRSVQGGFAHWCPGCDESHIIPNTWGFDGNVDKPTFNPSVKLSWGNSQICHYVLTAGQILFCSDCTHGKRNTTVPLPDWPADISRLGEVGCE